MKRTFTKRIRNNAGFTLIELLVVIIIIAILASIAVPTFLGQRQKAQDTAAYTLIRNGLTAVQAAFVETADYTQVTPAVLSAIEPSIGWVLSAQDLVSTVPPAIANFVGANAQLNEVAYYPESGSIVDLASVSASGNSFGMQINTVNLAQTGYVKVKVIDGSAAIGW